MTDQLKVTLTPGPAPTEMQLIREKARRSAVHEAGLAWAFAGDGKGTIEHAEFIADLAVAVYQEFLDSNSYQEHG